MERPAPIVIFAFNRPEALEACANALSLNKEAAESDLFIYIDGPRKGKTGEAEIVDSVYDCAKHVTGFKTVEITVSQTNKGLAASILSGVSEVMNKYGSAIVVEDYLVVAESFLSFMNQGLTRYKDEDKVFSICGYSNQVERPRGSEDDAYFCSRSSSWGWATWADRWNSCDWQSKDWDAVKRSACDFKHWGGSDCYKMLRDWREGRNHSWAIRFCYNQFLQNKLSLFPMVSLVDNRGFDGSGTNCKKWSRFKSTFDISGRKDFKFPDKILLDRRIWKQCMAYHSFFARVWSRIMYVLYK